MDLMLFRPADYDRLYNCSGFNADLVPLEQRVHLFHGVLLIVLFVVFEVP